MKIIKSKGIKGAAEMYKLTKGEGVAKMKEANGQILELAAYILYEDERPDDEGEIQSRPVCAIMTPNGERYGTNSGTFVRTFMDMLDVFEANNEEVHAIRVLVKKSRAGREFVTCDYEN